MNYLPTVCGAIMCSSGDPYVRQVIKKHPTRITRYIKAPSLDSMVHKELLERGQIDKSSGLKHSQSFFIDVHVLVSIMGNPSSEQRKVEEKKLMP